jgi:cytochrome c-type biogenesis protein CcsB
VTETLAAYSLIAIYSAIAVYAIAFIAYVLDLSKRAAVSQAVVAEPATASRAAVSSSSGAATLVVEKAPPPVEPSGASRYERVAFALTILAWLIHVASIVLRGIAAGHVPWSNLFEFACLATAFMVGVFLVVQVWRDVRFLGAYVTGLVALLLGLASVNFYVPVTPLPPPLQSVWLVIHVFVATLGTGFFAVGGGLSIAQLLQSRREAGRGGPRFLRSFPSSDKLEVIANRLIIVGFAFWTFTLIAGAIWANRAWGRYWGWDTKEVWTFIIWVVFAGYIHARATRGWRGNPSAWLAIVGFAAVLFNFTVVNIFFSGLHAYSGLIK